MPASAPRRCRLRVRTDSILNITPRGLLPRNRGIASRLRAVSEATLNDRPIAPGPVSISGARSSLLRSPLTDRWVYLWAPSRTRAGARKPTPLSYCYPRQFGRGETEQCTTRARRVRVDEAGEFVIRDVPQGYLCGWRGVRRGACGRCDEPTFLASTLGGFQRVSIASRETASVTVRMPGAPPSHRNQPTTMEEFTDRMLAMLKPIGRANEKRRTPRREAASVVRSSTSIQITSFSGCGHAHPPAGRIRRGRPIHKAGWSGVVATDDEGAFRFFGLEPGSYMVATAPKVLPDRRAARQPNRAAETRQRIYPRQFTRLLSSSNQVRVGECFFEA